MPHDFRNKSFQKVLRGYAPEEVDEYIAYLNEEYRKLERRTADSERKLALALKKLDENTRNAAAESVGPAAREAAAKLIKDAEAEAARKLEYANDLANASADGILENANAQADKIVDEAIRQAEEILAQARAEAEVHRDDVKKAQDAARSIYTEIGSFRDRLFALYNEHLDSIEGITDAAQEFMNGVDGEAETSPVPEETVHEFEESPEDEPEISAEEEVEPEKIPEPEEDTEPDEDTEPEEAEEAPLGDEVASNLAFMDRLFASLQAEEIVEGEDLYIDLSEEEEYASDEYAGEEYSGEEMAGDFEEDGGTEEDAGELPADENEDFPSIMIDWKKRSAVSAEEVEEDVRAVDESDDFRPADGFEDFEEEIGDFEEVTEENYDDYRPGEIPAEEESEIEEFEEEEEEEQDEFHDMDQIFNEDKSKREMSLTDEFNIIFDDSKSSQNVKEISRQPIVTPENPKSAKKHKKF